MKELEFEKSLKKLADLYPDLFELKLSALNSGMYRFQLKNRPYSTRELILLHYEYMPALPLETAAEITTILEELGYHAFGTDYEYEKAAVHQVHILGKDEKDPENIALTVEDFDLITAYKKALIKIAEGL